MQLIRGKEEEKGYVNGIRSLREYGNEEDYKYGEGSGSRRRGDTGEKWENYLRR